jgi:predicted component of type VI protein secretion system
MPAQLISLNEGSDILLDKPILLLGRHPECDVQIESRKVSRRHCCIAHVDHYLLVRDLDSTNGIRINGKRVTEGKLAPGDELTIGTFRYRVIWDSMVKHPHPPQTPQTNANVPVLDVEDDLLECCDQPVPLPEPRPPAMEFPAMSLSGHSGSPQPPREEALLIPDSIDLLPSDLLRRPPGSLS